MAVRQPGDLGVSIVNRPSDGSERVLPNALVVYSSAPTGPLAYLYMTPGSAQMYTGGIRELHAEGPGRGVQRHRRARRARRRGPSRAPAAPSMRTGGSPAGAPGTGFMHGDGQRRHGHVAPYGPHRHLAARTRRRRASGSSSAQQLGSTVPSHISWDAASDVGLGVAGYELAGNASGAGWATIPSGSALNRSAQPALTRNGIYRFAVRATDKAGNIGNYADRVVVPGDGPLRGVRLDLVQPRLGRDHLAVV